MYDMLRALALAIVLLTALPVSAQNALEAVFYGSEPIYTPKGVYLPDGKGSYHGPVRVLAGDRKAGFLDADHNIYYFFDQSLGGFVKYQGRFTTDGFGNFFTINQTPIALSGNLLIYTTSKRNELVEGKPIFSSIPPEAVALPNGGYASRIRR
jgi:hypothetical protein